MKTHTLSTITALFFIFTTTGCVTYTSMKDEPRQKVRFTSARAAQTFYDAYLAPGNPEKKRSLAIGVGIPYCHWKTTSENVRFNAAIQLADHNHDGIVSEKEALTYGREVKPAPSK